MTTQRKTPSTAGMIALAALVIGLLLTGFGLPQIVGLLSIGVAGLLYVPAHDERPRAILRRRIVAGLLALALFAFGFGLGQWLVQLLRG